MGSLWGRPTSLALLLLCLASWVSARVARFEINLTWEDWSATGTPRKMILTNGQFPAPSFYLRQGDDVEFLVNNQLPFSTTVHFHGIEQLGTPWSDGTPGLSQRPIPSASSFLYKWHAGQHGSYFYHAHSRGQIDDGFYGALYIHPDDTVERPFSLITDNKKGIDAMCQAEKETRPIILSDWRQLTSEEIWNVEERSGLDAFCVNALLINGKGSVICLSRETLDTYTTQAQRNVLGTDSLTDIGCIPPTNEVAQGNYPHDVSAVPPTVFEGCRPSNGPTEVLSVDPSTSYASFDLISSAGISLITFSIDEHPMYIYAIDGRYIEPVLVDAVTVPNGNRYSIMVALDKPAGDYTIRIANSGANQIVSATGVMSYNTPNKAQEQPSRPSINIAGGNITADVVILDENRVDENRVVPFPVEVPAQNVDETYILTIDRFNASYLWILGNSTFPLELEESSPLLYYPSTADPELSIRTRNGSWVDLIFHTVSTLQPPHPIHKHSNKFFMIGRGEGAFNYASVADAMREIPGSFNLQNPQIRDTFPTPPSGTGPTWMAIRYQVVNPGAFLLHCHIQMHLSGGMALALLDGADAWPQNIPLEYRLAAMGPPSLGIGLL